MDQPNLNMRQRRWLDVLKDYDCEILYHPGKANVVADAPSRKAAAAPIRDIYLRMTVITPLLEQIKGARVEGLKEERQKCERIVGRVASFDYDNRGLLTLHGRVWVPYRGGVRQVLMDEAHKSRFSIHPGVMKMYRDLRTYYWWPCMKRDVAWHVERCLTCRKVKAEH